MFWSKKRKQPPKPQLKTFILEPILTPSGLFDGGDETPDLADPVELQDFLPPDDLPDESDPLPDALENAYGQDIPIPESDFEVGVFMVGDSGDVGIDYLFDGGKYKFELAIFSLEGMDDFDPGSEEFITEAATRAASDSEWGHIVVTDRTEGAKFSGTLGESNDWNSGDYQGVETVSMRPGDQFGFMLVPNGTVQDVIDNPDVGGSKAPLFSLGTANPDDALHFGQIADVTGDGSTFVMEDVQFGHDWYDEDYNDLIFQVRGATGEAPTMDELIDPADDWRDSDVGQELVEYAESQVIPVVEVPDVEEYEFPQENQPLVGVLDTGVSSNNPDLDYDNITLGKDWIDGDDNPLLESGEGNEHGTHILGIIGAERDNNIGIDGVNDDAPLWVGRAVGSGNWAESLTEFVDTAQESGQPNAVMNLSLDLTQVDSEGNVTTRYEFTPTEREAIEYARQNGVLIVAAAGNDGGVMSALGQASQEFDNIITVGAAEGLDRADYSSYGRGLDILADGGTPEAKVASLTEESIGTMAGTSVATAKVSGGISQVWAANPELSYRQVIEVVKNTAQDLQTPGWDAETGAGLFNLPAAVALAKETQGEVYNPVAWVTPETWRGEGRVTATERAAQGGTSIATAPAQPSTNFTDSDRVDETQPEKYYQFTVDDSGYFEWTLTRQNAVPRFPSFPNVSIINADGSSGKHKFKFIEEQHSGLSATAVAEGQQSTNGGDFLEPGTYYLKIKGGDLDVKDYSISTEWIPDESLTTTQFILSSSMNSPFIGSTATELNASGELAWTQDISDRRKMFGLEVKDTDQLLLNLSSEDGDVAVYIDKYIGSSDNRQSIARYHLGSPGDREIEINLNRGKYAIYANYGMTGDGSPKRFALNGQLASFSQPQPTAPQPGEGKVPANAGNFIETIVSNGIVSHYYTNGYLTIQPNGHAVWYALGSGQPSVTISGYPLPEPEPIIDPDGNGSMRTARRFNNIGIDLGDGFKSPQTITLQGRSVGGTDLNDYHSFTLNEYNRVKLQLLGLNGKAGFELIRDTNGNGQIDEGEILADVMSSDGLATPSRIRDLEPGKYYVRVFPEDANAGEVNYDLHFNAIPTDNDGNGSLLTAESFGVFVYSGYGEWMTGTHGSLGESDYSDYYRLGIGNDQEVKFTLEGLSANAAIEVILDKNGNELVEPGEIVAASTSGQPVREITPFLEKGTYYVRVRGDGDSTDYYISADGRAYYETGIDQEYQAVNNKPLGHNGDVIQLGNPTGNYVKAGTSPQGTESFWRGYENGAIYWSEEYGSVAIWYGMNDLYSSMGGTSSWLGFPTKREYAWEGGRRVDFEGGYIFWKPGREPKAYRPWEVPNEKPTVNVWNQTILDTEFVRKTISGGPGVESLISMKDRFSWSDADGDTIERVAFYDPTFEQNATSGYFARPNNIQVNANPAPPNYENVNPILINADQLDQMYYGNNFHTDITDTLAIAVFDGNEWSDPKAFNITVKATQPNIISTETADGPGQTNRTLNFRNYPWANESTLLDTLSTGTPFLFLEKVTVDHSVNKTWYKVRLGDGRVGYVWAGGVENVYIYDNPVILPVTVFQNAVEEAVNRVGGHSVVGYPIGDPQYVEGRGWFQEFRRSDGAKRLVTLQDEADTALWVHGDNYREYMRLGGPYGDLGFPTNEETPFTSSTTGTEGIWQSFSGSDGKARIHSGYNPGISSTATWGAIGSLYTDMGGANSWLGAPTRAEWEDSDGITIWSEFERGLIAHNKKTGDTVALHFGQTPEWRGVKYENFYRHKDGYSNLLGQPIPGTLTAPNSGLLVEDELRAKQQSDMSIKVSPNIFNLKRATSFLEVRDKEGNIVDIQTIDASNVPTDLVNAGIDIALDYPIFNKYGPLDLRKYRDNTSLTFEIPHGGNAVFTRKSDIAKIYNAVNLVVGLYDSINTFPSFTSETSRKRFILGFARSYLTKVGIDGVKGLIVNKPSLDRGMENFDLINANIASQIIKDMADYVYNEEANTSGLGSNFVELLGETLSEGVQVALNKYSPWLGKLVEATYWTADKALLIQLMIDIWSTNSSTEMKISNFL